MSFYNFFSRFIKLKYKYKKPERLATRELIGSIIILLSIKNIYKIKILIVRNIRQKIMMVLYIF